MKTSKLISAITMSCALALSAPSASIAGPATGVSDTAVPEENKNIHVHTDGSTSYYINMRMVGDNLIHKPLYNQSYRADGTYDFTYLYQHVKPEIESADIAIINQETILVHDPALISSYPAFGTPESIGDAVADAGFDVIAHATNHTLDKGAGGILNSINYWRTNHPELTVLGIHDNPLDPDYKTVTSNNITVGFVNYTYGLNGLRRPGNAPYLVDLLTDIDIAQTMDAVSKVSDIQVAILHVGEEYHTAPTAQAMAQVNRFIDMGADIVLCAHPHVLEPYTLVTTPAGNTGVVYYSLGNFVSYQMRIDSVLSGIADINLEKRVWKDGTSATVITGFDMIPLVTHEGPVTTAFLLSDYTDEMAAAHALRGHGLSVPLLHQRFAQITGYAK